MEESRPIGLIVKKTCPKIAKKKRNCVEESLPVGLLVKKKVPDKLKKTQLRGRKPARGACGEEKVSQK